MVVNPGEIERNILEKEKKAFNNLEKFIDSYILDNYKGDGHSVIVPVGNEYEIRDSVLEKMLAAYNHVGWDTMVGKDNESGRYVKFSSSAQKRKKSCKNYEEPRLTLFDGDEV